MAQYERHLQGGFDEFLAYLEQELMNASATISLEGESDCQMGDARCAVRVYERYSALGGNRVSLNITLLGVGNSLFLSAISAGGSQAVLFKINTFGEGAFLDTLISAVTAWEGR